MNHAAPQSTVPVPTTARDSLAALLHQVLVAPNQGAHALAKSCATIAMAFAWLDQSDERLAARHQNQRERVLLHALTQALGLLEIHDLAATLRIVDEVVSAVAPLSGEPINLVVGTPCVFGTVCVHQGGA